MKRKKKPTVCKPKAKSRMFEELIARIEETLVSQGAVVKSPDFITDKVTGSMREVDGSIRYQLGSTPILITIECRRRSTKDDARWIEQLRSKKEDIGALQTIAVSWKGFGQPAIVKAAKYGIELRTYEELTVDGIQKLQERIQLTCVYVEYRFTKALAQFSPPVTGLEMSGEHIQGINTEGAKYPYIIQKSDGSRLSLINLLDLYQAQEGPIDKGLKPGEETSADFTVTFPEGVAHVSTKQGCKDVGFIYICITATCKAKVFPLAKASQYMRDGKVVSHVAECEITLDPLPLDGGSKRVEIIVSYQPANVN
jgi:hypothetical protein